MLLLTLFAFVAGAATALSPCVLPILPVALAAGATGGRRRPLGVVTGLALSFTFATIALVYVISALGLPDGLVRTFAIVVLIVFGLSLLVPAASARMEAWLSRLAPQRAARGGEGFGSGLIVGAGLGLVYAPCAGPILAGVITVSAAQPVTAGRLIVALAYGLGSAVTLYVLMLGGRRLTARLARRSVAFQAAMGGLMVIVAVAMLANLDTRFQTTIATKLPAFLVTPTETLESTASAERALADVRGERDGRPAGFATAVPKRRDPPAPSGRASDLPVLGTAPEFTGTQEWFNTRGGRPLTLAGLRGRVVLVDFWTYSCINCLRTLPALREWDARYRPKGLTIVGVHTPEFPFEKSAGNVRSAIGQTKVRYPVAQDNEFATWNAYGNQYWPAQYLIDTRGRVRFTAIGEGDEDRKEAAIRSLLAERGAGRLGAVPRPRAEPARSDRTTPESYLGAARAARFVPAAPQPGRQDFGPRAARLAAGPPAVQRQVDDPAGLRDGRRGRRAGPALPRRQGVPRPRVAGPGARRAGAARRPARLRAARRPRRARRARPGRVPAPLRTPRPPAGAKRDADRPPAARRSRLRVHVRVGARRCNAGGPADDWARMSIPTAIQDFVDAQCDAATTRYDDLRAVIFNGTLKRSPEPSHTDGLVAIPRRHPRARRRPRRRGADGRPRDPAGRLARHARARVRPRTTSRDLPRPRRARRHHPAHRADLARRPELDDAHDRRAPLRLLR